jgi:hypothetical protein
MERDSTTVSLHKTTVQRLGEIGKFNETYDDVVNRLIASVDDKQEGD